MAGLGNSKASTVRSGMVTVQDIQRPSPPSSRLDIVGKDKPSTWAGLWFVFALVMLYIIL